MEIRKRVLRVGAAAFALAPLAALAQSPTAYFGGSWGAYRINESALDEHDDLLRAFVGGQFTNWFGIEGSWTDFNRLDSGASRFDADGWALAAVLSAPIGQSSTIFAKAGQFWWDADSRIGSAVGSRDGSDPFFGIGLKLGLNDNLAFRLDLERYDVADVDLDTASIGIQLSF